ncbi:MAG TPA: biopolymer transporter ExbD [Candidatus Sulfotelmatobacter sp.]|jgi:biopolymer transport protein ExbD|nr:biopolymer transporter ExbD [Candidatus Sulfotelmatobacter sp.]
MALRVPVTARIGLALILLGAFLYGGLQYWVWSRTWLPLDMPISLSQGQIHTGEFEINLDGFWILVEVERGFDFEGVPCLIGFEVCADKPSILRASWKFSDWGRVIAQGTSDERRERLGGTVTMGRWLGGFSVPEGKHYALDVDVLEDGSRLNAGHPRLKVWEMGGEWRYQEEADEVFPYAVFLVAIGVSMLILSIAAQLRERRDNRRIPLTTPGPVVLELKVETGSSAGDPRSDRGGKVPLPAWFGIAFILLGVAGYAAVQHWLNSRIFVPVDMPVSLAAGHIRTGPFRINLENYYWVQIDTGQSQQVNPRCDSYSLLRTSWVLYREGKIVDKVVYRPDFAGFSADPGTYDLDVEVLSDASCLNAGHPRLRVAGERESFESNAALLKWGAELCVAMGVSLMAIVGVGRFVTRPSEILSVTGSESRGQNFQWAQRLPLRRPISGLPSFGLMAAIMYAMFTMVMMWMEQPVIPMVLMVHLLKPGAAPAKSDTWTDPLMVRVKEGGLGCPPNLYVNEKQVAWEDLDRVLKQELAVRREWVVYVGGDDNVDWNSVVNVIDVAKGRGARVVLTTGNTANKASH